MRVGRRAHICALSMLPSRVGRNWEKWVYVPACSCANNVRLRSTPQR